MTTPTTATARDARQFATPNTPEVQTENTVGSAAVDGATDAQDEARAAQTDRKDTGKQEKEAPQSDPDQDTTELPPPEDGGHPVDDPPVNPKAGSASANAAPTHAALTQGERLESTQPKVSPETEQRIEREIDAVAKTGEVKPRSVIAPAKPAREPTQDEQRMAEDFDPPPLAHRADVGT